MNRATGASILVFGIVLATIGAILYWAVNASTDGFDVNTAGLILFWVGVGTSVIGLGMTLMGSRSSTVSRSDQLGPGQYEYEEEHRSL